ncbi:MAG: ATP-binding protein [Asticcacaulis sp.]|uniref:hybrid sensor histidine kinase/response regulator n=1 Tax=Asticcacaulis sp. TaxID=1872648 RepID=UPI0039E572ED
MKVYEVVSSTPYTYDQNEIDRYGQSALAMSGDERVYALWRVLYAYKINQNEAKINYWHARIVETARKDNDPNLDLLARFMFQAYQNEINGYSVLSEREWNTYLTLPDHALQNIVALERERQLQYMTQWAEAIDMGENLIVRVRGEGKPAEGLLSVAQQNLAYSMTKVGDYDSYADHALSMVRLSQSNAFFLQKMDMLYDLAFFAAQDNDIVLAQRLQALYSSYVRKYNVADLKLLDEELCATVQNRAGNDQAVIDCLKNSSAMKGTIVTTFDAVNLRSITKAYARMFNVERTEFYLAKLRNVPENIYARDLTFETYVEAYLKTAKGDSSAGFRDLGEWVLAYDKQAQERQVFAVKDMYKALRKELDSQTAESRLLVKQVEMGHLLLGAAGLIGLLLLVILAGGAFWVLRMRRMQWRLREAHEHAEAANTAKSRFLAVMSHELRTPLNGVLGMAQALKKEDLNDTQKEQVDVLVDSGQTLMALLNDVLDMSRIEAGKIELAPTPSTLKEMIERVINTYGSLLDGKDVMLRYELGESGTLPMTFDVLRVYQCLSNLVSNALKFTEKGTVRIMASAIKHQEGGYRVRIEVKDTGIGMSKATLDKLFEAFSQAEAMTARKYGGSGLGLNISRRLAELMGGTLTVTSEEDVGSSFVMTFEAGEATAATKVEAPVEIKAQPKHDENADLPGMHILLVDDHPVNRKVARLFLEPFGFIITEAVDGQEALDLDMSRYDLVLMDLNMPRLGGLEATRIFRSQEPEGQHVPIVALTADAMHDQIEACHAAGMDAHIAKPIIMETLIDTVAGLLHLDQGRTEADAEVA